MGEGREGLRNAVFIERIPSKWKKKVVEESYK